MTIKNQLQSVPFETHTLEVIFSQKTTKASHSKVFFNSVQLSETFGGLVIDSKLTLVIHIKSAMAKTNKTIVLIWNFQHVVLRLSLVTGCKAFIRSHLDYDEIIFD